MKWVEIQNLDIFGLASIFHSLDLTRTRRAGASGLPARRAARGPEPGAGQALRGAEGQRQPARRGRGQGALGEPPGEEPLRRRRPLLRAAQVQGHLQGVRPRERQVRPLLLPLAPAPRGG